MNQYTRYFNVIEAVKLFHGPENRSFYTELAKLGHTENQVDAALRFLTTRENRFIEPVSILAPKRRKDRGEPLLYIVTEKGAHYLRMARWPEYQERCGSFGRSLCDETTI